LILTYLNFLKKGFKHVESKKYRSRLLQIKSLKETMIVREFPMNGGSLNLENVFILDLGLKLYQLQGSKCSIQEKLKGTQLCQAIADEREKQVEVHAFGKFLFIYFDFP